MYRAVMMICILSVLGTLSRRVEAQSFNEPNILFILIDDLGWMDLEFQGNRLVETPE